MSDLTPMDPVVALKQKAAQLKASIDHNRAQTWICHRMAEMPPPSFIGISFLNAGEEIGKCVTLETVFDDIYLGGPLKKTIYDCLVHLFEQYSAYALNCQAELDDIERQLTAAGEMETGLGQ